MISFNHRGHRENRKQIANRQLAIYNGLMNGALIIDKPAGLTSHDVVARVRKIVGERRVGHTGTLDPFATGLLVVLLGRATRLAQFLSGAEKEYEAIIRLGVSTETGDATGVPIPQISHLQRSFSRAELESALASLRGEIEQIPPMHSAKKIGGQKLYELARRGEQVERKPVRLTISEFEVEPLRVNEDATQDLSARVVCSAGTYIRVLAEDLGKRLGVGAQLAELRRTRAGEFRIEDAITLEQLSELPDSDAIEQSLLSPDAAISHLPSIQLNADEVSRTCRGIDLPINVKHLDWGRGQSVRMRDDAGNLIAIGICEPSLECIHPKVVIAHTSDRDKTTSRS
jgi:tRNA pseudouridine55 synthase